MDRAEKLELMIMSLESSKTEEDIVSNLTKIVKGFSTNQYKSRILSNPYFKSLIPDVKILVKREIDFLKDSLNKELDAINIEMDKPENTNVVDKLHSLKRDCLSLLYEISQREQELSEL